MSQIETTTKWFREAVPNPNNRTLGVQMGVHFEEVTEMIDTVSGGNSIAALHILEAKDALHRMASHMKDNPELYEVYPEDRKEMLDALCDQTVTATGVAYMMDFDFTGAMDEVNRSNYSKFVDGKAVFTEQGKIAKGPDFFRPNLDPYL